MSTATVRCERCGHENQPGARFCSSCGVALAAPGTLADTMAIEAIDVAEEHALDRAQFRSSEGLLIVTRGPSIGARYALDAARVDIGRHPESQIFLDDIAVSRHHAEILHDGAVYTVRDAGSLNGTYLNRASIDEAILTDGDELQIGAFKLVFFHGTKP